MSAAFRELAPAKINLTLRVLGRRADGYHELESLVAFGDLADTLTLEPGEATSIAVGGPFASVCGATNNNLVLKAAQATGLRAGLFSLDKQIPVAAGLGGGSADAAAALRLIAKANGLPINDPRILAAARAVGADVTVCLASRACIMRGAGETLSPPLALPAMPVLLVNPGVALPTASVFAGFRPQDAAVMLSADVPLDKNELVSWLIPRRNDLTRAAVACVPAIADVLAALAALPGCRLARMSGSGPTCFGMFDSRDETAKAAQQLKAKHGNWWITPVNLS